MATIPASRTFLVITQLPRYPRGGKFKGVVRPDTDSMEIRTSTRGSIYISNPGEKNNKGKENRTQGVPSLHLQGRLSAVAQKDLQASWFTAPPPERALKLTLQGNEWKCAWNEQQYRARWSATRCRGKIYAVEKRMEIIFGPQGVLALKEM